MFNKAKKLFSVSLAAFTLFAAMSLNASASPLITAENPLSGESVKVTFIDSADNIVHVERLVRGQAFKILDRYGGMQREFVARQNTIITIPAFQEGYGWSAIGWRAYFRIDAFYLEPLYMIEITVSASGGEHVAAIIAPQGHGASVLDADGRELYDSSHYRPAEITLPEIEAPQGYAFSHWELENTDHYSIFRPSIVPVIFFQDESGTPLFQAELPVGTAISVIDENGFEMHSLEVSGSHAVRLPEGQWEGREAGDMRYIVAQTAGAQAGSLEITMELVLIIAALLVALSLVFAFLRKPNKKRKANASGRKKRQARKRR